MTKQLHVELVEVQSLFKIKMEYVN